MSDSPPGDDAPAEKVSDGKAPNESAEEFWSHFVAVGGEQLKNLLKPQPAAGGHPPEIPPENECWQAFSDIAEKHIRETAETLRNQLDNTLLFATLFSAINSAFLIYTLPTATTSVQDPTNQLLLYIIQGMNNESASSATHFLATAESSGRTVNVTVNAIFSISLMLSIIATLTAVLGQTWVTNYGRNIAADPQELREERRRKVLGADRWHFQPLLEIVLPIILQLALVIFCAGFTVLLWSINKPLAIAVLPVLGFGFLAIAASVCCALWDPDCPYQTPISSRILPKLISGAYPLWYYGSAAIPVISRVFSPTTLKCLTGGGADEEALSSTPLSPTKGYYEKRHDLAARLRRPLGSTGTQHAELVSWALHHSSDAVAVGKVISTLLHGDIEYAENIGNDVYHHPVFDQLLSGAQRYLDEAGSNSQQLVWKASLRAVWQVFLAPSVVLLPNTLQSSRFKSLLDLEVTINMARPEGLWYDPLNFEDVLDMASCFKLLRFLSSDLSEEHLRSHNHFAELLEKVDRAVYSSYDDSAFVFRRLYYLGEFIGALMGQMDASITVYAGSKILGLVFYLYDGLRRDCEPAWNKERSIPEFRRTQCIRLMTIMGRAAPLLESGLIRCFRRPAAGVNAVEWNLIRNQLREIIELLTYLPEAKDEELTVEPGEGSEDPLSGTYLRCRQSIEVSDIQNNCLYFAKWLLDARTLDSESKETLREAVLVGDVAFQLLKIIDLIPNKDPDPMLSICLTFLRIMAGLDFASLDWDYFESSIPIIFGLCRATTEWVRRDEQAQKIDAKKLEDLNTLASEITHKLLKIMSDKKYGDPEDNDRRAYFLRLRRDRGVEDLEARSSIMEMILYLTDFLRGIKVEDLTKQEWTVLENLEWNPEHEIYNPAYNAARIEFVQQMDIAFEKRARSKDPLNHDDVPRSVPQDETGVHQEPREGEAGPSMANQSESEKERLVERLETSAEEDPMKEGQIEQELTKHMKDTGAEDPTDLSK